MFAQYFGQFLLNHALVTGSELQNAMIAQEETRVKLGAYRSTKGELKSNFTLLG